MKNGFSFLTDRLPTKLCGIKIDTRACTAIAVIVKMADEEASNLEKAVYAVSKLFGKSYKDIPVDEQELDEAIVSYLAGAPKVKSWKELHGESEPQKQSFKLPDFDFVQDGELILASFRQCYGLSLDETCDLHWWEFLALFHNLPFDGNAFSDTRNLRNRKPKKEDTPEMKAELVKAKRSVALKDTRSPEKKRADLQEQLNSIEL